MSCPHCSATRTTALRRRTTPGYRMFRCRACRRTYNERTNTPFNHLQVPTDVAVLVVLWRLQYKLSLRNVAEMFLARGFTFTHETVRAWEERLAPCAGRLSHPLTLQGCARPACTQLHASCCSGHVQPLPYGVAGLSRFPSNSAPTRRDERSGQHSHAGAPTTPSVDGQQDPASSAHPAHRHSASPGVTPTPVLAAWHVRSRTRGFSAALCGWMSQTAAPVCCRWISCGCSAQIR